MATIQIRDVPDDAYQLIRAQARAAGQSLQAYMRDQVIELAESRARKAETMRWIEALLAEEGGLELRADEIVDAIHAERR